MSESIRLASADLDASGVAAGVAQAKRSLSELTAASRESANQWRQFREMLGGLAELTGLTLSLGAVRDVVTDVGRSVMQFEVDQARMASVLKA
ncbi:MAG: hypothetical protein ACREND_03140, partial [Gemmatimonadaceae bacterium]